MLSSLRLLLSNNKAHVTYVSIILIIGLVTNYLFNQYQRVSTESAGYRRLYELEKTNIKVVTHTVVREKPIVLPNGTVGTERTTETRTDSLDLSTRENRSDEASTTKTASVTGRIPGFTAGLGLGIGTRLDVGAFAAQRLYGPYGVFVSGGSVNNFGGVVGYAGVAFTY